MKNPIDKDKTAEFPGLLAYPHHIGSIVVQPEDVGKLKSRALSAMHEQTRMHLTQIQKQVELLVNQAEEIQRRVTLSEKIYTADVSFEPFVGNCYHLYLKHERYCILMIAPEEWGKGMPAHLEFVSTIRLLSDHTWEIL